MTKTIISLYIPVIISAIMIFAGIISFITNYIKHITKRNYMISAVSFILGTVGFFVSSWVLRLYYLGV